MIEPVSRRAGRQTVNGRLLDAILQHAHFLFRAENGLVRDVIAPLRLAERRILDRLGELALREAEGRLTAVLTLERAQLELLEAQIAEAITRAHGETRSILDRRLLKVAERETQIQGNILRRAVPNSVAVQTGGLDVERMQAMVNEPLGGLVWQERLRADFGELIPAMQRDLSASVATGEGMGEAQRRLRRSVANLGINRATLIARTEVQRIANRTSAELYLQNADVIKMLRWVATLDSRTCLICGDLDGQQFPVVGPQRLPPVHPACRCVLVPVTKSFEEMGINAAEFPELTRASMAGDVPAVTTYEQWFGRQPASFKREVLGPGRYRRYRDGDLRIREMVKDFRVLNLDELPLEAA